MSDRIPPKGQTVVDIEVNPVSHGAAVTVTLRSLTLRVKDDHRAAMLYAWRALGTELQARGTDLYSAMAQMPFPLEREDLSDD